MLGSPSRNFSCDPGHSFGFKRSPRRQSYQANVWHQGDEMLSNAVSSSWAFSLALLVLWGCRWQIWQLRPARASILPSPRFCDIMWHPFVETTGWSNLAKLSGVQSVILARHMLDVRKLREAHLEDDASKFSKSDGLILQKNPGNRTMAWQNYGMALWNILTATLPWHQGRIILEWNNIDQPSPAHRGGTKLRWKKLHNWP